MTFVAGGIPERMTRATTRAVTPIHRQAEPFPIRRRRTARSAGTRPPHRCLPGAALAMRKRLLADRWSRRIERRARSSEDANQQISKDPRQRHMQGDRLYHPVIQLAALRQITEQDRAPGDGIEQLRLNIGPHRGAAIAERVPKGPHAFAHTPAEKGSERQMKRFEIEGNVPRLEKQNVAEKKSPAG